MRRFDLLRRIWRGGCGVALFSLLVCPCTALRAQGLPARTRAAELTAFGMYTILAPDYGAQQNFGITTGGDFTKIFTNTALSLEFRFKNTDGSTVGEQTLSVGPRFDYRWPRLQLYADLLVGAGEIKFANKNTRGSNGTGFNGSVVYTYGIGVDYNLTSQWAMRFDGQSEHWDLQEKPKVLLFPRAFSMGIVYRLRFAKDRSRWNHGWNANLRSARLRR